MVLFSVPKCNENTNIAISRALGKKLQELQALQYTAWPARAVIVLKLGHIHLLAPSSAVSISRTGLT